MRNRLRNRLLLTLCTLVALLGGAAPAGADGWCSADPIVRLNGNNTVQILVAIPIQYETRVDNPTRVEIKTPQQISRQLLYTDAGFNGKGEDFSFSDIGDGNMTATHYRIWVKVTVPIATSASVPIRVTVISSRGLTQVFHGTHTGTTLSIWYNK